MAWVLEAARIWLLIFGCAAGGWALGFGMGYGRGAKDAPPAASSGPTIGSA